jgi:hypothetical protein
MRYFVYNRRRIRCCDDHECFVHDADGMHEQSDWIEWEEFRTIIHNLATAGALERARKLGATPWSWYPGCGLESVW